MKDLGKGTTVVITTHYIEEARRADLVGLMRGGRLLEEDNPQSILEKLGQPTLERAFLTLCKAKSANNRLEELPNGLEDKKFHKILNLGKVRKRRLR